MNEDLDRIDQLVAEHADRHDRYRAYRQYYDGDHDTQLTKRMRRFLQIKYGEEFNSNHCPIVVDALSERLTVTGFEAGGQADVIWQWWQDNRMDGVQGIVHLSAVRDGDTYLMVEWDNEASRPAFTPELAYDGTEGVHVFYSGRRQVPTMAMKVWKEGAAVTRLNLYYPDRIERYVKTAALEGRWAPYQGDDPPVSWWTDTGQEGSEPLGIPIVHFRNRDQGYNYGQSELRDVVPLQNALNKSIIDVLAAADTTGFRVYWMIGDNPGSLPLLPGSWVYSPKPPDKVQMGVFPGEDLEKLLEVKDHFAMEIAKITRTPTSYFQMSRLRPAEGTLKQEEAGLVARAKSRTIYFGNSWEHAMEIARRLHNAFGEGGMDEAQRIEALWADVETRNEKEHIETLAVKREKLGVPKTRIWREAGYDQDQIDEMMESPEYQASVAAANMASAGFEAMRGERG